MALETTAQLLGRVPIFQGLTSGQLESIAAIGRDVTFEHGSSVVTAGERGEAAFLILSGSVVAQASDSSHPPELLGYGTLVGELAMLVETTFTVSVTTRWPVRALALERSAMFEAMEDDPSIAHHFAGKLLERLCALATDLRRVDGKFAIVELSLDQAIAEARG
jgi:CRP-like cAMP-binding protein